jgi:hypothetical protein
MGDETAIVKAYAEKADAIVQRAKELEIHDQKDREFVATVALEARFLDDEADEREKEITRPLNEALKKIRSLFKEGARSKLQNVQDITDGKLKQDYLDFKDANDAANAIKLKEAEIESEKTGVFAPALVLPDVEKTINTAIGKITIRKDIKVIEGDKMEILKAIVEKLLPLTLAEINLGEAKRYFKSAGIMSAPGFIIKKDAVVSGRK